VFTKNIVVIIDTLRAAQVKICLSAFVLHPYTTYRPYIQQGSLNQGKRQR
jgi:hypothetical protein